MIRRIVRKARAHATLLALSATPRACLPLAMLCTTALTANAMIGTADAAVRKSPHRAASHATHPMPARPRHTAHAPSGNETIHVASHRNVSSGPNNVLTRAIAAQFIPGTNPLAVVDRLPGVSFSSTDPLGIDTWGASIYVRGFFMDQLGVTLDGMPLNEQIYQSVMGVNIIQSVISDDIGRTVASEGPGGVEVPSTSLLGGTIQFETSDPADKAGGKISQTFGSYGSFRSYFRGDSGKLNSSGTKVALSYARADENLWVGHGSQFQQQLDAKLVQPIGQSSSIKTFFNWSQLAEWGYNDLSLAIIDGLGSRVPHLYPNYNEYYNYAAGNISLPTTPTIAASGQSPYLYDGGQAEIDYTGGINMDFALTDRLRWHSVVYAQSDIGYYTYSDATTPSANGAPFSEEVWQTHQQRFGATTALRYELGHHSIDTGIWFENNNQYSGLFWYNEPLLGHGAPLKTVGPYDVYGAAFRQGYGFRWNSNIFQYHLMDTWHPISTIRLSAGFKSMLATTSGGADQNNPDYTSASALPSGSLTASSAFLPHVGGSWRFLPHSELFFDIAENMRAYQVQPYGGTGASPWSVQDQATFLNFRQAAHPEKDWVYAGGYRYTDTHFEGSVSAYHADAHNRLQSATQGTILNPISTVIPTTVHLTGVDAALTIRPLHGLSIYNSVSYFHGTYAHNIVTPGTTFYTAGKSLVNYPKFMYKANATYDFHGIDVHVDAHYYSRRYFSYTNDTSIPGYWLTSAGLTTKLGDFGVMKNLKLDLNIYNLLNAKYISMMGENGNPLSGDYQSFMRGPVRQFFGTVSAAF